MRYDVFISHASEDKVDFVQALAQALEESGLSVWYDDFTLRLGESLIESINIGLSQSTYGIVVLSPIFFEKKWPKRELNALLSREDSEEKVIIPIWHQITKDEVLSSFPLVADKLAVMSNDEMRNVIRRIFEVVKPRLIAQKHYEEGLMFEDDEMLDEAMSAYIHALRLDPKHLDALRHVNRLRNLNLPQPLYVTETYIKVGIVRFYNERKGFGYISGEDGKEYYVHRTGLEEGTTLRDGDRSAFLAVTGFGGPKAGSVRII
jgi:cold shock CspA family protein